MFSTSRWENLLTIRGKSGEKDGPSEKSAVVSHSLTVMGAWGEAAAMQLSQRSEEPESCLQYGQFDLLAIVQISF